jgi:hypothetical protein
VRPSGIARVITITLAAQTASARPAPDQFDMPRTITLEAPADHYQEWKHALPCPSGRFSTRITVFDPAQHANFQSGALIHFWDDDQHQTGTDFQYRTLKGALPLRVRVRRMETEEIMLAPAIYAPGQSIDVEISWTGSQNFLFAIDGRTQFKMKTKRQIAWFNLVAVGSRSVFVNNKLECDLIA